MRTVSSPNRARIHRAVGTLLLLSAALLANWAGLYLVERQVQPANLSKAQTVDLYISTVPLNSAWLPSDADLRIAAPLADSGRRYIHRMEVHKGGYFVIDFALDELDPNERYVLFLQSNQHIVGVKLNNEVVFTRAVARPDSIHSTDPAIYLLPQDLLMVGENQLVIGHPGIFTNQLSRYGIGTAKEFLPAYEFGRAMSVQVPWAAVAILLMVGVLFAVIHWPAGESALAWALSALVITYAAYTALSLYMPGFVSNLWREAIIIMLFYGLVTLFAIVVAVWSGASRIWTAGIGFTGFAIVAAIAVISLFAPDARSFNSLTMPTDTVVQIIILPALAIVLAWNARRKNTPGLIGAFTLMVCILALCLGGADHQLLTGVPFATDLPITHPPILRYGLVLGLGLIASLATEATRARHITLMHNEILTSKLREQEIHLEASFLREKELTRQETLMTERQRLMRDMHDGIGGQLVSLIVQSWSGKVQAPEIGRSLSAVLDDLRLIVDSLDTAGDSLGYAIGAFRDRLGPKLQEADIELVWHVDPKAGAIPIAPEKVLQMLRILQEACSNAIQHANARTLTIDLRPDLLIPDKAILLSVTDDGDGIQSEFGQRKGSRTMAMRARDIGGELKVESQAGEGTRVELRLEPELAA